MKAQVVGLKETLRDLNKLDKELSKEIRKDIGGRKRSSKFVSLPLLNLPACSGIYDTDRWEFRNVVLGDKLRTRGCCLVLLPENEGRPN